MPYLLDQSSPVRTSADQADAVYIYCLSCHHTVKYKHITTIAFVKTTEEIYIASGIVEEFHSNWCSVAIDVVQKSTAHRAPNTMVKIRSLESKVKYGSYSSISCSPCGDYLAACGSNDSPYDPQYFVDIWCCSGVDGVKLKRDKPNYSDLYELYRSIRCSSPASAITFSTDSSKLMITNALTNSIEVHSVQCAVVNAHFSQQLRVSDEGMVNACFSHDGSIVLSASSWLPAIQVASKCDWVASSAISNFIHNGVDLDMVQVQELKQLVNSNPGAILEPVGSFGMLSYCVYNQPAVVKQLIDPDTGCIQGTLAVTWCVLECYVNCHTF
jgi:hypothetical protein